VHGGGGVYISVDDITEKKRKGPGYIMYKPEK
jgi:hypothetical protein